MKILGIDLGLARTGIAISDFSEVLASPFCVIEETNLDMLTQKIGRICCNENIKKIVVGLPKNMNGSEGDAAKKARSFADQLENFLKLPVLMVDERKTTISANNILNETNTHGKRRKKIIDAVAAAIILHYYLDYNNNHSSYKNYP